MSVLGRDALTEMLGRDCARPPDGARAPCGPAEQTLQWMFTHRGYFHREPERVLWREWPTSAPGRQRRADVTDALPRVVLEALRHWICAMRHRQSFETQIRDFGVAAPGSSSTSP